ncbi:MAG TPA: hypothetical protein VGF67_12815 [Ktedonobacteraceae bacterium]|jgi:hypothetical protein
MPRRTPEGVAWARGAWDGLVHGQIETLVTAFAALPAVSPLPGQSKSVPEQSRGSLRMRSLTLRAQGMPIGSGIAEATCQTIVSTRTKRTGMRLSSSRPGCPVPLRTSVLKGSSNSFWQGCSHALVFKDVTTLSYISGTATGLRRGCPKTA